MVAIHKFYCILSAFVPLKQLAVLIDDFRANCYRAQAHYAKNFLQVNPFSFSLRSQKSERETKVNIGAHYNSLLIPSMPRLGALPPGSSALDTNLSQVTRGR